MKQERKAVGRRQFLRTLGVGTAAVAAGGPLVSEARADSESNDEKRRARYKADSPHIQAYYRVNRYPSK
jgi:TAT (twin-arginine translocation) pathway signal sequence